MSMKLVLTAALAAGMMAIFAPHAAFATTCSEGLSTAMEGKGPVTSAEIAAATGAQIVIIPSCAKSDVVSTLSVKGEIHVRDGIAHNQKVLFDLHSAGYTIGQVLGGAMVGNRLYLFVEGSAGTHTNLEKPRSPNNNHAPTTGD